MSARVAWHGRVPLVVKTWLWLILIPAPLFAGLPIPQETQPSPPTALFTNSVSVEIEVRPDSIILLANNTVVTLDELDMLVNPFTRLLVQYMCDHVDPNIVWHVHPGGENLAKKLSGRVDALKYMMGYPSWLGRLEAVVMKDRESKTNRTSGPYSLPIPSFQQNTVFVDVHADYIMTHPEQTIIAKDAIHLPDGEFERFLDRIEAQQHRPRVVLVSHPGSAVFLRHLRQLIRARGIAVGFEAWDPDRTLPEAGLTPSSETE